MRQRAWILMFTAGLCAVALPGCAATSNCLLNYFRSDDPPPAEATAAKAHVGPQYLPDPEEVTTAPIGDSPNLPFFHVNLGQSVSSSEMPPRTPPPELMPPPNALPPREDSIPVLPDQLPPPQLERQPEKTETVSALPPEPEEPLLRALYWLLKKQPEKAVEELKTYDATNQEVLIRLMPIFVLIADKKIAQLSAGEVAALEEQVEGVLMDLHTRTPLAIDKMCLCEKIDGYGQYTPKREGYTYTAGTGKQWGELVNVYIELHNMTSQRRDRYYTTILNGTISIRDGQGTPVWTYNYRKLEKPLQSLMPRSDCYRSYDFFVPAMPPGKYTLTIEVCDETCQPHRIAQKSVEFNVAAP